MVYFDIHRVNDDLFVLEISLPHLIINMKIVIRRSFVYKSKNVLEKILTSIMLHDFIEFLN